MTSDLHGNLPDIPECDVLIVAGDVCPNWDHTRPFQRLWLETNFSNWLREAPADVILGIGGNHDYALEESAAFARKLPWIYLLDEGLDFRGVKFWGFPWVPNLSKWAFHLDDAGLDRKIDLIPNDMDIVIAHGPPWGTCDKTVPRFGGCHAGFPGTNGMLKRVKPEIYVCGHIHEGYGFAVNDAGVNVMNVSRMTEDYEPTNPVVEVEFDTISNEISHDQRRWVDPGIQAFLDLAY